MAQGQISMKRIGVDKTNARMVVIAAIAAFLVVFFLVASFALFSQLRYHNRIIGAKKEAKSQLEKNLEARDSLVASYKSFASAPENIIGGNPEGTGAQDGTNSKIVLDSLPSKYDFPALTSSLEKLFADQKVTILSITGTDDEIAQSANQSSNNPLPVEIPFEVEIIGNFQTLKDVLGAFDRSI